MAQALFLVKSPLPHDIGRLMALSPSNGCSQVTSTMSMNFTPLLKSATPCLRNLSLFPTLAFSSIPSRVPTLSHSALLLFYCLAPPVRMQTT